MKAILDNSGCTLIRESGDKRIPKESTVVFHMRNLLNAQGHRFTRYYPHKHGLTACELGLYERRTGTTLWHERYAIELAHEEFNKYGSVFFQRVNDPVEVTGNADAVRQYANEHGCRTYVGKLPNGHVCMKPETVIHDGRMYCNKHRPKESRKQESK